MTASLSIMLVVFGAIAGGIVVGMITWGLRFRGRAEKATRDKADEDLSWGIVDVFAMIDIPAALIDQKMAIKAASEAAMNLGLLGVAGRVTAPELVGIVKQAFADDESVWKEIELSRGPFGDATLTVEVRAARLANDLVLIYLADRSEYQRLEEVRRDFIANISHELKTPIGAISLLAEALLEASDDPEMVTNFSKRLSGEADRLAAITREIIELSRLQADGGVTELQPVDLNSVVAQAVDQHRIFAASKGIDIVAGRNGQVQVRGDEARLVLALSNLVSNAIQYSPEGSRVGVGITHTENQVEISVTDQGVGMTKEESERVFERFYRTDQARSRATGGTGLGLSIVKHIIAHHGGDVRVWTQPGAGSTFTVRLPAVEVAGEEFTAA